MACETVTYADTVKCYTSVIWHNMLFMDRYIAKTEPISDI